jgi:hypothetical protein
MLHLMLRLKRYPVACLVSGLLIGFVPAALRAADSQDSPAARDMRHTVAARAALLRDKELGPLNLGVRVHDRVAVLWGPVPSAELAERAVRVLRQVPDLLEVRNELIIQAPEPTRPQLLPESVPPALPAIKLPGYSGAPDPLPLAPGENVRLKPALTSTVPLPKNVVLDPAILPAVAVPGQSVLEGAVDRLRTSDSRYGGLVAQVRGDQVYLSGRAARWQDVHELAAALVRVPGVTRVVLEQIRTGG